MLNSFDGVEYLLLVVVSALSGPVIRTCEYGVPDTARVRVSLVSQHRRSGPGKAGAGHIPATLYPRNRRCPTSPAQRCKFANSISVARRVQ